MKLTLSQNELECLRDLQRGASAHAIPIVAVGASARQLVFDTPHGIARHRSTNDWDFGVRVANWEAFAQLRKMFTEQGGAFNVGDDEHRLVHLKTGIRIDLIPFGGLENDGRIRWPDGGLEMTVLGFSDALEHAIEVDLGENVRLKVATTPLLVALKIFAFYDRHKETHRDLDDLWHVMRNYPIEGQEFRFFEEPTAAMIGEAFNWDFAGIVLLGIDVARACSSNTTRQMIDIVATLCDPYSGLISPLVRPVYSVEDEETQRRQISNSFDWLRRALQLALDNAAGR